MKKRVENDLNDNNTNTVTSSSPISSAIDSIDSPIENTKNQLKLTKSAYTGLPLLSDSKPSVSNLTIKMTHETNPNGKQRNGKDRCVTTTITTERPLSTSSTSTSCSNTNFSLNLMNSPFTVGANINTNNNNTTTNNNSNNSNNSNNTNDKSNNNNRNHSRSGSKRRHSATPATLNQGTAAAMDYGIKNRHSSKDVINISNNNNDNSNSKGKSNRVRLSNRRKGNVSGSRSTLPDDHSIISNLGTITPRSSRHKRHGSTASTSGLAGLKSNRSKSPRYGLSPHFGMSPGFGNRTSPITGLFLFRFFFVFCVVLHSVQFCKYCL